MLDKIEVVSGDLAERRSHVTFTPRDLEQVAGWEGALPESALTKYFNNWVKVHRAVQAANREVPVEEAEQSGEEEEEETETVEKPTKSGKQVKKAKTKTEVNGKDKKNKGKKKGKVVDETKEDVDFVDNGDLVEDIVLSD